MWLLSSNWTFDITIHVALAIASNPNLTCFFTTNESLYITNYLACIFNNLLLMSINFYYLAYTNGKIIAHDQNFHNHITYMCNET